MKIRKAGLALMLLSGSLAMVGCNNPGGDTPVTPEDVDVIQSITLNATTKTLNEGDTFDLIVTFNPNTIKNKNKGLTWSSSDKSVAVVDSTGTITALKEGKTTITAKSNYDDTKTATCEVTVQHVDVDVHVTSVSLPEDFDIRVNNTKKLTATVLPENATNKNVDFEIVEGSDLITLDKLGNSAFITAGNEPGTVKIKAVSVDGSKESNVCVISVLPPDVTKIVSVSKPADILSYESELDHLDSVENLPANGASSINAGAFFEYDEADIEKQTYKVGNQGAFKFVPVAKTDTGSSIIVNYDKQLEKFNTATNKYETVEFGTYATAVDNEYQFENSAIGEKFRLTVTPSASNDYYISKENRENCTVSHEFKVIEGYNVYNLAELSLFDNHTPNDSNPVDWTDMRRASGIEDVTATGCMILHTDIKVTSNVLPNSALCTKAYVDSYLSTPIGAEDFNDWYKDMGYESEEDAKAALYNSPKDWISIFDRNTNNTTDTFGIEGNYFNIDYSELKTIKFIDFDDELVPDPTKLLQSGKLSQGSHAQLFSINVNVQIDDEYWTEGSGDVFFRNLSIIGNGGLGDKLHTNESKGGLITFKNNGCELIAENVVVNKTFNAFMCSKESLRQQQLAKQTLDRCKATDMYNSAIYLFGTLGSTVTNSWFTKAGGPLVLMDENKIDDYSFYKAELTATNTYMYNPVAGTEPWFVDHEGSATLMQEYIMALGNPLSETGWVGKLALGAVQGGLLEDANTIATYIGGEGKITAACDFIAVDICANKFADNTNAPLTGKFVLNDNGKIDMADVAKVDPGIGHKITPLIQDVAPIIMQSSVGGKAYVAGADQKPHEGINKASIFAEVEGQMAINPEILASDTAKQNLAGFLSGDYMSYYLDPVLGLAHTESGYFIGVLLGTTSIKNWIPVIEMMQGL